MRHRILIATLITLFAATICVAADDDPYLWLEEVESEKAVTMKNGKPATQGICPECGTKMFKIGKSK